MFSSFSVFGCASKDEPAACPKFDYSKYTPGSTTLTLTTDIAPIIKTSCAVAATCHGSTAAAMAKNEPQLGPITGAADMASLMAILAAVVAKPSAELPSMPYVTAGDPDKSWLMKKIEGVQGCGGFTCTAGVLGATVPCGVPMPQAPSDPLPAAQVSLFRDWIKGGAKL